MPGTLDQEHVWRGRRIRWGREGAGPPVVLCHGTPWSSWLWQPYARALAADFTVYRWDMPGFGQSSKDPGHDVDLATQGEAFAALLTEWGQYEGPSSGPWRPHVVAHDVGGAVALRAHLLHGASYASLCLVDVVALRPWGSDLFQLVAQHEDTFAALPDAAHRGLLEAYVAGASHRGLRPDDLAALVAPWLGPVGRPAFYRQVAQADERHTDEVQELYGTLDLPVHVVWGSEDTWIPVDRARALADAIPGASLEVLPDAGHLVQLDAPVELSASLHRWLLRQVR